MITHLYFATCYLISHLQGGEFFRLFFIYFFTRGNTTLIVYDESRGNEGGRETPAVNVLPWLKSPGRVSLPVYGMWGGV